jgi:ribonuclease BN (tRNA processing enzyme)
MVKAVTKYIPGGNFVDSITFLGTGGARVVMARQVLATGGIWLELEGTQISLDPGPGALVHATYRKLDPANLNGIIISHRHLDHCGDGNVMVEAMTAGGLKKKGSVFTPSDALGSDGVILRYLHHYVDEIVILREKTKYHLGKICFETSMRHRHGVETYGFIFEGKKHVISYIPDTVYFDEVAKFYRGNILIICVLLMERSKVQHLSLPDVKEIVTQIKPEVVLLTHFGMNLMRANPSK